MENKKPSRFDVINLFANITGPLVLVAFGYWAMWSFNAKMELQRDSIERAAAIQYVTKEQFKDASLETNLHLARIDAALDQIKETVGKLRNYSYSPKQMDQHQ